MVLPPLTTDDELNEELLEEMKRAQVLEGDTERIDIQVTPMKTVKLMLLFKKKKINSHLDSSEIGRELLRCTKTYSSGWSGFDRTKDRRQSFGLPEIVLG